MTMIGISRLNLDGMKALYAVIADNGDLAARALEARRIATDPAMSEPVPGLGEIDAEARFHSCLEFAAHVWPAVSHAGIRVIADPGINAFLHAVYLDQFLKKSVNTPAHFILDPSGTDSGLRMKRNHALLILRIYSLYKDDEIIVRRFLGGRLGVVSRPLGRIGDGSMIMSSKGAMELIATMFMAQRSGRFRKLKDAGGRKNRTAATPRAALDLLCTLVFGQLGRNYDVESMTAAQLFHLIPNVRALRPWKEEVAGKFVEEAAA